jgi:hypothetical protein
MIDACGAGLPDAPPLCSAEPRAMKATQIAGEDWHAVAVAR